MFLIIYFKVRNFSFHKNIFCYIYIRLHNFDFKYTAWIFCVKKIIMKIFKSEKKRQQRMKKKIRHRKKSVKI